MLKASLPSCIALCALSALLVGCGDEKTDETKAPIEVLDPAEEHFGKSYSEWNTEWFKWIYETPYTDECLLPVDDATGENCTVGQSGDVFFLAGSIAADTTVVVRDKCTVPAGKALFFPLTNIAADNGGVPPEEQPTDDENRAAAEGNLEQVQPDALFASVDGEEITELERFKTDVVEFAYTPAREPNFYSCLGATGVTDPIDPSYAAGYYVMLAPLSAGKYALRFGIDQADLYTLDITYNLTVQ